MYRSANAASWYYQWLGPFRKRALDFVRSESGPAATEYAVMLSLVIVALIPAITSFREAVATLFVQVATALDGMN